MTTKNDDNETDETTSPGIRPTRTTAQQIFQARNQLANLLEQYVQEISDDDEHALLEAYQKFARVCRQNKC
jgi:hypothetical protein